MSLMEEEYQSSGQPPRYKYFHYKKSTAQKIEKNPLYMKYCNFNATLTAKCVELWSIDV